MDTIFDFLDYRDYLKHYYEKRKQQLSLFSYQMFGSKLGLSPSALFHVLEKKRNLPVRCVPATKDYLGLTGRAAEYFDLLLAVSRTKNAQVRDDLMNKAFQLRDIRRRALEKEELTYLRQWWTVVVRSYLEVNQGRTHAATIAKSIVPPITEEQARDSIELLKNLGLVRRYSSERVELSESHLTIRGKEKFHAIREFQTHVMRLGARSLQEIDPDRRDISTLTMAIDEDCFQDIKSMLQEFRRQIQIRIDECVSPSRVMQLNLALFPVSKENKSGEL